jgi:hypothetical protein
MFLARFCVLIENFKLTSKINECVCAQSVNKMISMWNLKDTRIFVNEVETQYEKNHSGATKPRISTIQKTRLVTK